MPKIEREVPTLHELATQCRDMAARAKRVQQRNYLLALAKGYDEQDNGAGVALRPTLD